jgi:prevent-host-death family protein
VPELETAAMRNLNAGQAREHFAEIVNEAAYGATRTVLLKHKKPVAAVVPIADLELLQALEDLIDVHEAKAALDEARATGTRPLDRLMAELEDRSAP